MFLSLKFKILITSVIFYPVNLSAQELLGLRSSRHAMINGIYLNAASPITTPYKWDINVIAFGFFLDNNNAYSPQTNLFSFLKRLKTASPMIYNYNNLSFLGRSSDFVLKDDFTDSLRIKGGYLSQFLQGPSFMVSLKNHGFGFFTALRTNISAHAVDEVISSYGFEGILHRPLHFIYFKIPKYKINALSWGETGINYNYTFNNRNNKSITIGGNLKFLQGFFGGYFINNYMEFIIEEDSVEFTHLTSYGYDVDWEYAYTDIYSYFPAGSPFSMKNFFKGKGVGADFGLTLLKKVSKNDKSYLYRAGISLIDAGSITFSNNARKLHINTKQGTWERIDSLSFRNPYGFDTTASSQLLNDPNKSFQASKFNMPLPTAISAQFDLRLWKYFFLNTIWIQRIPKSKEGIERINTLSINPRFEIRQIQLIFPVLIHEYKYPRIGIALWLWTWFVIGTDKASSIFLNKDFTGSDIYFAVKLNGDTLNRIGGKKNKIINRKKSKSSNDIPCYIF